MKMLRSIVLLSLLTAVIAGCDKKESDPQPPVEGLENTFLTQQTFIGKNTGDTNDYFVHKYDSLNRIYQYNFTTVFYNTDGTIKKILNRVGESVTLTYDEEKRIKRLIRSAYPIDTIDFFYSNKEKPDYIKRTFGKSTVTFHYNEDQMIDTIYTVCKLSAFNNKEVRHWQNGNMVKAEIFTDHPNVYNSIDIEYDSKPCIAETMHLSKDLLMLSEYDYLFWVNLEFLTKNNRVKETHFDKFDNTTTIYPHTVIEYNSKGLPIKVDEGYYFIEYKYEER